MDNQEEAMSKESSPAPETLVPPVPAKARKVTTKGKKEEKDMRKDLKTLDDIIKTNEHPTLVQIKKKYQHMFDELRKNEALISDWQTSYNALKRENASLATEYQRVLLRLGKTESICQSQQQQSRQIKEDFLGKIRDEQEKRKDVTVKLQETLGQLDIVLAENSARNAKLQEDNVDMSKRLMDLHNELQKHTEQTKNAEKENILQKKLYETDLTKTRLEYETKKELMNRQIELLNFRVKERDEEIKIHKTELAIMEKRVDEYIKKYNEMEPFISESNKMFDTYKKKLEESNKASRKLEQEGLHWQKKNNASVREIIRLTNEVKAEHENNLKLQRKVDHLDKLCRQLQLDRSGYLKQLKSAGLVPNANEDEATLTAKEAVNELLDGVARIQLEKENAHTE